MRALLLTTIVVALLAGCSGDPRRPDAGTDAGSDAATDAGARVDAGSPAPSCEIGIGVRGSSPFLECEGDGGCSDLAPVYRTPDGGIAYCWADDTAGCCACRCECERPEGCFRDCRDLDCI